MYPISYFIYHHHFYFPQSLRFCRSKCFSNFKLKRNPRRTRWTKAFRKASGKDLSVDSVFDFERKRNRPIKYVLLLAPKCSGVQCSVFRCPDRAIQYMLALLIFLISYPTSRYNCHLIQPPHLS